MPCIAACGLSRHGALPYPWHHLSLPVRCTPAITLAPVLLPRPQRCARRLSLRRRSMVGDVGCAPQPFLLRPLGAFRVPCEPHVAAVRLPQALVQGRGALAPSRLQLGAVPLRHWTWVSYRQRAVVTTGSGLKQMYPGALGPKCFVKCVWPVGPRAHAAACRARIDNVSCSLLRAVFSKLLVHSSLGLECRLVKGAVSMRTCLLCMLRFSEFCMLQPGWLFLNWEARPAAAKVILC